MILSTLSVVVILCCALAIVRIVARYSGVLASIDIEKIPEERHAAIKDALILNRFRRKLGALKAFVLVFGAPFKRLGGMIIVRMQGVYRTLLDMREEYRSKLTVGGARVSSEENLPLAERCALHIERAHSCADADQPTDAEREYIAAIALDAKYVPAYDGLKKLYADQKQWNEACEVASHLCRLQKDDGSDPSRLAELLFDCSEIQVRLGKFDDALKSIKKSLKYQENNPKYLHALVDIHLSRGERLKAESALDRLRAANPENQRISEIKSRVEQLSY